MKYLKLFESEENMVENIIEVFQDMEDFGMTLECEKMYEFCAKLDKFYSLKGYSDKKSTNVFYGYFREGQEVALEWLDGNGYGFWDYDGDLNRPEKELNGFKLSTITLPHFSQWCDNFYSISLSGNQEYVKEHFSLISKEIKNNILRLGNMYDLKLHTNKDFCYQNGIICDIYGHHDVIVIDWLSDVDIDIPNVAGANRADNCSLGIYLK